MSYRISIKSLRRKKNVDDNNRKGFFAASL